MKSETINKSKLLTVANYAKKIDSTPQWVYQLIKNKKLTTEVIDGVIFINPPIK